MLVTFSGLDGSGKSTLIDALRQQLAMADCPVTVLTMYDHVGVYACIRLFRDRVVAPLSGGRLGKTTPNTTDPDRLGVTQQQGGVFGGALVRLVRSRAAKRVVILADVFLFWLYRGYVEGVRRRVLILDRYFFDSLADIAAAGNDGFRRIVMLLMPRPNLSIFVDVSPEKAFARKHEYSVEYNTRRRLQYETIFKRVPGVEIIANDDLNGSLRQLSRIVNERVLNPSEHRTTRSW